MCCVCLSRKLSLCYDYYWPCKPQVILEDEETEVEIDAYQKSMEIHSLVPLPVIQEELEKNIMTRFHKEISPILPKHQE